MASIPRMLICSLKERISEAFPDILDNFGVIRAVIHAFVQVYLHVGLSKTLAELFRCAVGQFIVNCIVFHVFELRTWLFDWICNSHIEVAQEWDNGLLRTETLAFLETWAWMLGGSLLEMKERTRKM